MVVAVAVLEQPESPEQLEVPEMAAKARLKAWVKDQIEGEGTLRAPDVATRAVEELGKDLDFLADFGREMLRSAVYELVLDVISEGRTDISAFEVPQSQIQPTQSTDSRVNLKRRLAKLERRYASWYEHVEGKGHVSLKQMDDADLVLAVQERTARGNHELRIADFLEKIRLKLDGAQKVGERFVDLTELESIRTECMGKKDGD